MTRRFGLPLAAAAASIAILPLSSPLQAAELPPIKTSDANKVAECATPGRLMAYLKARNEKMDPRYTGLATEYMRHGEALGLRWDYAFFQMLLETGYLKYTGDVKAEQNNFAGLGATGGGVRGESFPDIATGARAHLQHLQMYAGEKVENPVAQRTRDVQSWGVLASWQQSIGAPITFTHLAKKWAPGTKGYASDIQTIAQRFFDGPCNGEDPQPELIAEARGQTATVQTAARKAAEQPATVAAIEKPETTTRTGNTDVKGSDLARRAAETARADGAASRAGLGATALATAGNSGPAIPPAAKATTAAAPEAPAASTATAKEAAVVPTVTILNPAAAAEPATKASSDAAPAKAAPAKAETSAKAETAAKTVALKTESPANTPASKDDASAKAIETASVAGAAKDAAKVEKKASPKCRVWTASYGGAKAIIIKAVADQTTNYTVLDVNEGAEKREAEAYISAYAKGGESVGEFASQTQALDKAFELCPEG